MSYDANKVIQIAEAEIGYLEKKTNAKLDDKTANAGNKNYTKYARDLDALGFYNGRKNGFAWCDIFVDWCFVRAYGLEAALKLTNQPLGKANCGAGCRYSRNYYKKAKRLFDAPQPGDQIFFWPQDAIGGPAVAHTGLVYRVDGTYVYTIEGNTSGANGVVANGGGVCKKKYRLTYNRIAGYGRPDWGVEAADAPAADPAAPKARHILVKANSVNLRAGDGVKYANNASASIRPERPSKPDQGQCVCALSAAFWRRPEKRSQISCADSALRASESRMRATASRSREAAAVIQASRVSASALRRRLSGEGRRRGRRFPARTQRRGLRKVECERRLREAGKPPL